MTWTVKFGPAAEAEIDEALVWYENQSQGLGAELARAIRVAESALKIDPQRFPVLYTSISGRQVHRVVLRRFPFSLHYLIDREMVTVIACMHARRDPRRSGASSLPAGRINSPQCIASAWNRQRSRVLDAFQREA